ATTVTSCSEPAESAVVASVSAAAWTHIAAGTAHRMRVRTAALIISSLTEQVRERIHRSGNIVNAGAGDERRESGHAHARVARGRVREYAARDRPTRTHAH